MERRPSEVEQLNEPWGSFAGTSTEMLFSLDASTSGSHVALFSAFHPKTWKIKRQAHVFASRLRSFFVIGTQKHHHLYCSTRCSTGKLLTLQTTPTLAPVFESCKFAAGTVGLGLADQGRQVKEK